ncbi:Manganese resistance protein [Yarrowia sp. C11]|nr:Manganese resistance protein [Yarrowia sp. E02]KAG5373118.1 Manganese resistance protein [Yarrowia sp. C11]
MPNRRNTFSLPYSGDAPKKLVNPNLAVFHSRRNSNGSSDSQRLLDHRDDGITTSTPGGISGRKKKLRKMSSQSVMNKGTPPKPSSSANQPRESSQLRAEHTNYNSFRRRLSSQQYLRPRRVSDSVVADDDEELSPLMYTDWDNDFDNYDLHSDFEGDSDLNSEPSSRRNSDASSLDDVCMFPPGSEEHHDDKPKVWPELSYLEEFAEQERKEDDETSSIGIVNEVSVSGPLRPKRVVPWKRGIKRQDSGIGTDFQFRFTYFREDLEATIHSQSISGLVKGGQSFADLFPERVEVEGTDRHEKFIPTERNSVPTRASTPTPGDRSGNEGRSSSKDAPRDLVLSKVQSQHTGSSGDRERGNSIGDRGEKTPRDHNGSISGQSSHTTMGPTAHATPEPSDTPFWLDVLNPTEEEMKVLSKAFGIHPLTTEDIFLGETREKVELFRNYYLICFRSFDVLRTKKKGSSISSKASKKRAHKYNRQLKPLNMYIIVFHFGVLTFHFLPTVHPVNVRRRARLLRDYLTVSSDWISYAIIDDITDAFQPMIDSIQEEVDDIENDILKLHAGADSSDDEETEFYTYEDELDRRQRRGFGGIADDLRSLSSMSSTTTTSTIRLKNKGDNLYRIGETRKKVMSLSRLLGNKADVIKGFAKRCNEQWQVAPRSEIGLYLGDIQDHIVTMVQSVNHFEKILARAHSNCLAQVNIDMTKINNDTNDVLGKITVLGTIVLPMNIVTGLWGMNVIVPGQEHEGTIWFWGITASLFFFAIASYWGAKRVYGV